MPIEHRKFSIFKSDLQFSKYAGTVEEQNGISLPTFICK